MFSLFQFDFILKAFIAGITIAIVAPLIGNFLVIRRYSLFADTLAHVSLVGIALGLILNVYPFLAALIVTVFAAVIIEQLRQKSKILGESLLAIFLSGSLALAVVLISSTKGFNVNLYGYLFGSINTVSSFDLLLIVGSGIFVSFTILFLYKELFTVSLDEEFARAGGIPVKQLNTLLGVLSAIAVSLAIKTVGILLIGALMVIPVATAFQFSKSFRQAIFFSILISLFSVISGLYLSYFFDLASGGTVILVSLSLFILSLIIK